MGVVLHVAALARLEHPHRKRMPADALGETLLADATKALKDSLSSSPDEASKELSKLRLSAVTAE